MQKFTTLKWQIGHDVEYNSTENGPASFDYGHLVCGPSRIWYILLVKYSHSLQYLLTPEFVVNGKN